MAVAIALPDPIYDWLHMAYASPPLPLDRGKRYEYQGKFLNVVTKNKWLVAITMVGNLAIFCGIFSACALGWAWMWNKFSHAILGFPEIGFLQACIGLGLLIVPLMLGISRGN